MRSYLPRLTHIFYVGTHKHKLHSFTLCDANTHSHTLTVFTLSLPLISSFSLFWAKTYIYLQASSYKNHSLSHTHISALSLYISHCPFSILKDEPNRKCVHGRLQERQTRGRFYFVLLNDQRIKIKGWFQNFPKLKILELKTF